MSYAPRFITADQLTEGVNLYHLARTALSGTADQGKHSRKVWAAKELARLHPGISPTGAYKDLDAALS